MPLYHDYRPANFEEFYGNEEEIDLLKEVLERDDDKLPHSFFITGAPGTGKTTLARIIGTVLEVEGSDFHEYNNANTRGIDSIRGIDQEAQFLPNIGERKLYLLDECHRLTIDAWNALLKLLEEVKEHAIFVLATSEPEKITGTIKKAIDRRCFKVPLKPLDNESIIGLLEDITLSEIEMDEADIGKYKMIFKQIAEFSEGSPGTALNYLDKVIEHLDEDNCLSFIEKTEEATIKNICWLILDDRINSNTKWSKMKDILNTLEGQQPDPIKSGIMNYLKKVLLGNSAAKYDVAASAIADLQAAPIIYSGMAGLACVLYYICKGD